MAIKGNQIGSVYIKVRPDASDFRRNTQRQVGKDPIEVEVEVELDESSAAELEKDVDKAAKKASKKGRIKFNPDFEGVREGINQVDKMLRDLESKSIEVKLDEQSLRNERDKFQALLGEGLEAKAKFTPDEGGYQSVLQRIAEIRRQKAEVEIEFHTDDASLAEMEAKYKAALEALEEPEPITFRYNEDLEGYHRLMARIDEIRRERAEVEVDLNVDDDSLLSLKDQIRMRAADIHARVTPSSIAMTEATMAALARDRFVDIRARVNARALTTTAGAFMSLAGLNTVGDFVRMLEDVAMNFDTVMLQAGTLAGAIGTIGSVGTVALGGLLTTLRDIAGTFQLIAAAPTAILSAFTGIQAWSSIWGGFEAALLKIPGALEALPPAAQRGVKAVEDLQDATKAVVQDNFWAQMNDELYRFSENVGPTVISAMGGVATQFGKAVSEMLDHTERLVESGQLQEFADNNTRLYKGLRDAAVPFFEGFMTLGIRGSKYLPVMGRSLEDMALSFRDFINEADRTGKIDQWIRTGMKAFKDLGTSVVDTFKILGNFADIFERLNVGGLEEMARGLERIEAFTASSGFQRRMENIFAGAKDGAAEAAKGFGDLVEQLYRSDQLVSDLLRDSGRLAGTFMSALASAGDQKVFQQGLLDSIEGVQDFVEGAQAGFDAVARIFGRLGTIGAEVAREIAPGLTITMQAIDGFLERIGPGMIDAVRPLTRVFEDLGALGTGPLLVLADVAGSLLSTFSQLPTALQNTAVLLGLIGRAGVGAALARASVYVQTSIASIGYQASITSGQVAGAFARMRLAGTVAATGIRTAFGAMWSAIGGAPGIILGGLIGVFSTLAGVNAEAEASVDNLTRALRSQEEQAYRNAIFDELKDQLADFAAAGGDVSAVLDELESGRDAAEVANELALAYKAIGAERSGLTSGDDLFNLGMDEASFSRGIELAEKYGIANEEAGSKANGLAAEIQEKSGLFLAAAANANLEEQALGGVNDEMDRMAEASPRFQLIADAIARVRDESSSAEGRVRDLMDTVELLGDGGPRSAVEFEKYAKTTMESVVESIEREMEGRKVNLSDLFRDNGQLNLDHDLGVEVDDWFMEAVESASAGMSALQQQLANGDIGMDEFNRRMGEEYEKLLGYGRKIGEELGLTGEELNTFSELFSGWLEANGYTEANFKIALDGAVEVEAELEKLSALGQEFDDASYEAVFDANSDGVVTKVEQAQRLAEMLTAQRWEVNLTGDTEEVQAKLVEVLEAGAIFDGTDWVATLNADGTLSQEAIDIALSYGLMFDGTTWTALLDADGEPSAEAISIAKQAGAEWRDGEWRATIDADATPSEAQIAAARLLGLQWKNGDYEATIDADSSVAQSEAKKAKDGVEGIPKSWLTQISARVTGLDDLAEARRRIQALKDKNVRINVDTHQRIHRGNSVAADGGFGGIESKFPLAWKRFADGGLNLSPKPTTAHIAPAGSYVTYAESETGGEAFIPLSPAKRERSIAIWEETGRRLGMADGGLLGGTSAPASVTNNINVSRSGATGDDIAQSLAYHMLKTRR